MLAIHGARLFDGHDVVPYADPAVLIDAGRIVDVRSAAALPDGVDVIEHAGATLLPGLVDAHVHLVFAGTSDPVGEVRDADDEVLLRRMRTAARRTVAAGVTTVRDLGDRGYVSLALRDELAAGGTAGPHLLAAGPPITTVGGHCWFLGGATTGDRVGPAVEARARRGVDVIKVMASGGAMTAGTRSWQPQFSVAELRELRRRAHGAGLRVAAHAHAVTAIERALVAGVDTIEHATFLTAAGVRPDRALIDRLAAAAVAVTLTLGTDPARGRLPAADERRRADVLDLGARLHAAGVRLVCASDAGVSVRKPHGLLPYAVVTLASRLPARDVLRSATSAAADACGLGDRKGRLTAGHDADLLVVGADPMLTPETLLSPVAVYRGGIRVDAGR